MLTISCICLGAVIIVTRAIKSPINATVRPVMACVISRTTAVANIIQLIANPFLSLIASFGSGSEEISTFSPLEAESSE